MKGRFNPYQERLESQKNLAEQPGGNKNMIRQSIERNLQDLTDKSHERLSIAFEPGQSVLPYLRTKNPLRIAWKSSNGEITGHDQNFDDGAYAQEREWMHTEDSRRTYLPDLKDNIGNF